MEENTTTIEKASKAPVAISKNGIVLQNMEELYRFSQYVSQSGLAPKGIDTPAAIFTAIEMGLEIGLSPMQSLQNIAVINGRPCVWGDSVPGLVNSSGLQEWYKEKEIGKLGEDSYGWEVTSKRLRYPEPFTRRFTIADAKKAELLSKDIWRKYTSRMLLMRARTYLMRDLYPDVLKGVRTAEEFQELAVNAEYTVENKNPIDLGENKIDTETGEIVDNALDVSTGSTSNSTSETKSEPEPKKRTKKQADVSAGSTSGITSETTPETQTGSTAEITENTTIPDDIF